MNIYDLAIGALTVASTVALVAKAIFVTLGTPAVVTKVGAALGLGLLGGPIGWAIFGTVALVGAAYFGYQIYQHCKVKDSKENDPSTKGSLAQVEELDVETPLNGNS